MAVEIHSLRELLPREAWFIGVGALAGLAAHHGAFIHGEWHMRGPDLVVGHVVPLVLLFAVKGVCGGSEDFVIISDVLVAFYSYLFSLTISILLYRVFFHRLTRLGFKGPWYARISKVWHVWAARHSRNFLVLDEIHKKYGDFVRTGPSEITIFHPDVFMAIDGPRSECIKADWYDLLQPNPAIITARNKHIHGSRRRVWNQGFTVNARAEYNTKVLGVVDQLDRCIEAHVQSRRSTEMRDLCYFFGFDAMGLIVFDRSFDMLQSQGWHITIARLQRALSLLGPVSPAPWLFHIGFRLAPRVGVLRDWFNALDWCAEQMRERVRDGRSTKSGPDLTHYLMEKGGDGRNEDALSWLNGDSLFAIVAGSAPTSATLVCIFWMLARYPLHADQVRKELDDIDVADIKLLTQLPHLNAVINETMRLYPAPLSNGARKTTDAGTVVAGTFIPPHTTILCPRYSISRREDCFVRATEFIPARWTSRPELVLNKAAFAPYGTGHHNCLGRTVSLDIMRLAVARVLKRYQFRLLPGSRVEEDMVDEFLMKPGPLSLSFALRE
ncbi:cytochrome P450 [Xylariomycetidae sp. FL2044]|nr:cytochrome P450 [Xylariomycetidae sp. FL2044]